MYPRNISSRTCQVWEVLKEVAVWIPALVLSARLHGKENGVWRSTVSLFAELVGSANLLSVWPRLVQYAVGDDSGNFHWMWEEAGWWCCLSSNLQRSQWQPSADLHATFDGKMFACPLHSDEVCCWLPVFWPESKGVWGQRVQHAGAIHSKAHLTITLQMCLLLWHRGVRLMQFS